MCKQRFYIFFAKINNRAFISYLLLTEVKYILQMVQDYHSPIKFEKLLMADGILVEG